MIKISFLFYSINIAESCKAGWPVIYRPLVDSAGWTMASPDQQLLCNGQVTAWTFQCKNYNPFRAIVWRPINGSATKFRIVGINDIPASPVYTPVVYTVPDNQRITVSSGDVIGWSFGDSVLAYNSGGAYRVRWLGGNLHGSLQVNQVRDINTGVEYRQYSIAAMVGLPCE